MARATNSLPVPDGPVQDERGTAHARIHGPAVTPHIMREHGLPDGRAQTGGGHRIANNAVEDVAEGAHKLAEAREHVMRIERRLNVHARNFQV